MIKPGDPVNLLCSEHGFVLMNCHAYATLLKTIRGVVIATPAPMSWSSSATSTSASSTPTVKPCEPCN